MTTRGIEFCINEIMEHCLDRLKNKILGPGSTSLPVSEEIKGLAPAKDLELCVFVCVWLCLSPLLRAIPVCVDCSTQVLT